MKAKLHAFVASALSRKSTVSFTLQPLRIRRKASLPTRQTIGSDADTTHISLPGKQTLAVRPAPFLNERAIQHFFSSLDKKNFTSKRTQSASRRLLFFLRRDVTFRLVIVKETRKVFKLVTEGQNLFGC
jgi:hypothetical protein